MFAKKGGFSKGKSELTQSLISDDSSSKSKGGLFGSKEKNRSSDDGDYAMKNMEKRRHKTSTIADEETVMESTTGEEIVWPEDNEVNWDVILVFENPDYAENLNKEKPEGFMTMKEIMFEIQSKTGLLTYMFYSVNKKLIFCKVGATIDRIKKAADELDYNMLLDEHYLATEVDNGEFPVQDEPDISLMKPYECIYGPYERENEYHDLYHCPPDSLHPFRSVDRIKLVLEVLQSDEDWGAGLELFALKQNGSLLNYYPLREAKFVQALEKDWMPWHIYPWEQPIDDIRDYFGEKIGLYFEFLGHYTSWLLPLSIVGTITGIGVFIESLIYKDLSEALGTSFLVPGCCVFVAFWAQFMLEFWKRKESTKSMEWGMSSFEDEETDRAEYYGDKIFSFINGQPIKYFPPSQRAEISRTSNALIMAMILLVIACVAVIFYGKYYVNNDVDDDSAAASGSQGLAIVNALQIQVLNYLYQELAIWLTNRENHRTDTEHEDSLIAKLFLFQFVNSYASFFYIAYIKQNVGDECVGSCMEELSIALATIFLTRLIVGNATKFLTFYGAKVLRERTEKQEAEAARLEGNTDYLKEKSRAEKDYHLDDWDPMLGTLENYSQISVEFGFVTLFVAAFPLAPLFAYVSNVVEIRSDGYTLLHHTKRPIPSGAQDIGTWMDIFQMTALASVITNAGIICFTMELIQASPQGIVWAFICLQYSIIGLMALFAYIVPDVPEEVTIQLQRMQHLTDMAYGRLEIEDNEFEVEAQEYCIFDIDNED